MWETIALIEFIVILNLLILSKILWNDRSNLVRENTSLWVACNSGDDSGLWANAMTRANKHKKDREYPKELRSSL